MIALRDEEERESPPRPDRLRVVRQGRWLQRRRTLVERPRRGAPRHADFFEAILEAVTALRGELALTESRETLLREAWMRKCLRAAEKDGFQHRGRLRRLAHAPPCKRR
jgi:hypothetical protein